jgi:hypothetical protein
MFIVFRKACDSDRKEGFIEIAALWDTAPHSFV